MLRVFVDSREGFAEHTVPGEQYLYRGQCSV